MRTLLSFLLASLAAGAVALLPARGAVGQELENCGFETGDFTGWTALSEALEGGLGLVVDGEGESQYDGEEGDTWVINDGSYLPEGTDGGNNFTVDPFEGDFSALSEQTGPTLNTLYQDIELPSDLVSATLTWAQIIRNHATVFDDPDQEFRVEVRDTDDNVLEVLFSTDPADPLLGDEWQEMSADLSDYIGETIRITFVEQDTLFYFNVHIDEACVIVEEAEPTPQPTARPNIAAALSGVLIGGDSQRQAQERAAAATAAAGSAAAAGPIRPPNTGDGGLAEGGNTPSALMSALIVSVLGAVGLALHTRYRLRR